MAIYYKRRNKQGRPAKADQKKYRDKKICPSCGGHLKLSEEGKDRDTYSCTRCASLITFTNGPRKDAPEKKYSTFVLRDKSPLTPERTKPVLRTENMEKNLGTIRSCMEDQLILSFDYAASSGKKSVRNVEPYKLTQRGGEPILYAYDLEAEGIRTFKLGGMTYVEKQSYAFSPRHVFEDKLAEDGNGEHKEKERK
jgi:predicted DNA-binding transcriptional regulator YafY